MSQVIELRQREQLPSTETREPYLLFTNPGALEIQLVKLLGVSVKENDDPIGFFGTGLKYAMAIAIRLGGGMTIITGGQTYEVGGKTIHLRDKEFTQVTLNGEELGFTTELGKQWEPWMVVRELFSNALDEGGKVSVSRRDIATLETEGQTAIALHGRCFLDVQNEKSLYFLDIGNDQPVSRTEFADAYPGRGNTVFYRGIRIHQTQFPLLYRYNLLEQVTLTEDRTLKYAFSLNNILEKAIITSEDHDFVRRALTAGDSTHEGRLEFDGSYFGVEPSAAFKSVCSYLLERMPENANKNALNYYRKLTSTDQPLQTALLTKVQQLQLDKAIAFMDRLGCNYLHLYPIQVVTWLGENIHGQAKDGNIYLSVECFDRGTKYVASTLYEEYVHCQHGLSDLSRGLQTWLFDRVVSLAEELHGEPL